MAANFGYVVLGVPFKDAGPLIEAAGVSYQADTYEQATRTIGQAAQRIDPLLVQAQLRMARSEDPGAERVELAGRDGWIRARWRGEENLPGSGYWMALMEPLRLRLFFREDISLYWGQQWTEAPPDGDHTWVGVALNSATTAASAYRCTWTDRHTRAHKDATGTIVVAELLRRDIRIAKQTIAEHIPFFAGARTAHFQDITV